MSCWQPCPSTSDTIACLALSGAVDAVASKAAMRRLLPDHSPQSLAIAGELGGASWSCSYGCVVSSARTRRAIHACPDLANEVDQVRLAEPGQVVITASKLSQPLVGVRGLARM